MLTYEEWRDHLFELLVRSGVPGRPLYLFVDRSDLAEAAGLQDAELALDEFAITFRRKAGRAEPFLYEYCLGLAFNPDSSGVAPPYFLALIMSVLAVTEAPIGASHGVYRRQNDLLGREPLAQPPPGYTEHVPALWRAWNKWLLRGGSAFGTPTARSHVHWTHQGWARSQGLFRHQDRVLVQDWFEDRGLRPGDTIDRTRLVREFESWLKVHRRDGASLLGRLNDEAAMEVLADLLESELGVWRGQAARSRGERRPRGLLVHDEWADTFSIALVVSKDLEGLTVSIDGQAVPLDAATGIVTVPSNVPSYELLEAGEQIQLADGLVLRGGGEPAYVFADSVEAQGLLQERAPQLGRPYSLLIQDGRLPLAIEALTSAGAADYRVASGPIPGWKWVHGVTFVRPVADSLRDVLGSLSPVPPPRARLFGGLRVGANTYLTGGAPDVQLQDGADVPRVMLNGVPYIDDTPDDWMVTLPNDRLKPGEQAVVIGGETLRFWVVESIQAYPHGANLGHAFDCSTGSCYVFASSASQLDPGQEAVIGARVVGVDGARPLLVRTLPGHEVLVLTEEGSLLRVWEEVPRWMQETDLTPTVSDVARLLRGVTGTPAFILVKSPRSPRVDAWEVPTDLKASPGVVAVCERPDLVAQIAVKWSSHGDVSDRRRSLALNAAMRRFGPRSRLNELERRKADVVAPLAQETNTRDGTLDVILRWLSELEDGIASTSRFRDTWIWLAGQRGQGDGSDWRFALYQLQMLGHVEVDYGRSRVGVAPAVANVLTRGRGFAALSGSRPDSLISALTSGETGIPAVDQAAIYWDLHLRVQHDADGRQYGPVAAYLEWDPDHDYAVCEALHALGVLVAYSAADALLNVLPGLQRRLDLGRQLAVPPSTQMAVKERANSDWESVRSVAKRGLYRFSTRLGPVFAWREDPGEPLVEIDRRLGPYLLLRAIASGGRGPLLHRDASRSTLLVSRDAPLTPLLARALVLRTGLLPRPLHGPRSALGDRYLEYQNVDQQTAERVATLLRQPLGYL